MTGFNDNAPSSATFVTADDEHSEGSSSSPSSPLSDNLTRRLDTATTTTMTDSSTDLPATSGIGKKRKMLHQPINLLQFVEMIWRAFESTIMETNDETNSKRLIVPNRILKYLNNAMVETSNNESSSVAPELKNKNKPGVLLRLVLQAFREIEATGMTVQFSRETLKCFLATYSSFVTPSDFAHTNVLVKNEKRNKNSSPLPPGGILLEYVKGLEMFASNMSRADKNDVKALRMIMERDIRLPYNIYYDVRNVRFVDTVYETEKQQQQQQQRSSVEYVKIQASNFKRAVVLLTNSVILVWDGHQFVVPSVSIEKDIPTSALLKNRDEYALFDVMISTKNKVLDLMETNVSDLVIPDNYSKRLKLIGERFPDLKCVTLNNAREHVDSSYVRKPLTGDRLSAPSYVYTKPNLTGAIVGSMDKHVLVAFREDNERTTEYYANDRDFNNNDVDNDEETFDGKLIVKTKCNIAGPTMYMITSAAQQAKTATSIVNNVIKLGNKRYRVSLPGEETSVLGTPVNASTTTMTTTATTTTTTMSSTTSANYHHRLFNEAIPIEIKDGNKLGNFSSYDVSHVREYKPPALPKDAAIFDSFNHILNNPDNFVRLLSQSPSFGKIVAMLRKTDRHQEVGNIDFGNYDV